MSSLQKFHRRTQSSAVASSNPFPTVGSGSDTIGYRLGNVPGSTAYLISAPKSTEVQLSWGSAGTARGTISTTNGAANTTTLFGFGSAAHPAAYYAKTLTTGGYNSWYLPAKDELMTLYSNKSATPFTTANTFAITDFWCSTESSANGGIAQSLNNGAVRIDYYGKNNALFIRPVRQYYAPATIGDGSVTTGYWVGTAGDGVSKLIVAPKAAEFKTPWGSYGTARGIVSTTNGLANTNTLAGYGQAAHPAAYYCKTYTGGGFNTWYLPAKDELISWLTNRNATNYPAANTWTSTEGSSDPANCAWIVYLGGVGGYVLDNGNGNKEVPVT